MTLNGQFCESTEKIIQNFVIVIHRYSSKIVLHLYAKNQQLIQKFTSSKKVERGHFTQTILFEREEYSTHPINVDAMCSLALITS